MSNVTLSKEQRKELLGTLKVRFEKNVNRHKGLEWAKVQAKLEAHAEKLWSLHEMERTGGEPDVVVLIKRQANTFFMIVQSVAEIRGLIYRCVNRRQEIEDHQGLILPEGLGSTSSKTSITWSQIIRK